MQETTKGLYGLWRKQDAITLLWEQIDSGQMVVDDNSGMITTLVKPDLTSPWWFIRIDQQLDCFRYHKVLFDVLEVLPSKCLECWKVVVAPKTLRDLWKWRDVMVSMGRHGKLGIETRDYVPRNYGSYFYNPSYEKGAECLEAVFKAIDDSGIEVTPIRGQRAILKRGCTEFERKFGDTSRWEEHITEDSLKIEKLVDDWYISPPKMKLPDNAQLRTFRWWVEWAFAKGDETYRDFLTDDGKEFELLKPTVIYNNGRDGETA